MRSEALTPVFETPEALLADYADRGKTLCANRYGFGQRIWQSRVETDRIVMELPPATTDYRRWPSCSTWTTTDSSP